MYVSIAIHSWIGAQGECGITDRLQVKG